MNTTGRGYILGQLVALLLDTEFILDSNEERLRPDFHPYRYRYNVREFTRYVVNDLSCKQILPSNLHICPEL